MLTIGSRGSALAMAQAKWIRDQILKKPSDVEIEIKVIKTSADRDATVSIRAGSAVGVFVREIEDALLGGQIDLAVHSMKDVPTRIPEQLEIAAIPEREDARDVLITRGQAHKLSELPEGSVVGTGSVRRQAQILAYYPSLRVMDIRGNVDTRLTKLQNGVCDALILACAGMNRLGFQDRITNRLDFSQMLPAPGQGALALEIRRADAHTRSIAASLNDPAAYTAVTAERSFLRRMGGGCNIPVAVHAAIIQNDLEIDGLVAAPDGSRIIRESIRQTVDNAEAAAVLLADKILNQGGHAILEALCK
jgi:hydroxymethylbilane synthase